MELEKDQEVWIRVKVVNGTPFRVIKGYGEIYSVAVFDHMNESRQQMVFVSEKDIVTGPIYKDYDDVVEAVPAWGEGLLEMIANHADGHDDIYDNLEVRVSELEADLACYGRLEERVAVVEDKIKAAENRAPNMRSRVEQLERDIETHNSVIESHITGAGYPESVVEEWKDPSNDWWDTAEGFLNKGVIEEPHVETVKREIGETYVHDEEPTECECICQYAEDWPSCPDTEHGCWAEPTEILELVINHRNGKFLNWSMHDPNNPGRKFGEEDVEIIEQVLAPVGPPCLAGCNHEYWDRCELCDPTPEDIKEPHYTATLMEEYYLRHPPRVESHTVTITPSPPVLCPDCGSHKDAALHTYCGPPYGSKRKPRTGAELINSTDDL